MTDTENPNQWYAEQRMQELMKGGTIALGARSFFRPGELLLSDAAVEILTTLDPDERLTSRTTTETGVIGLAGTPRDDAPVGLSFLGLQLWTITPQVDPRVAAAELEAVAIRLDAKPDEYVDREVPPRLIRVSINHVFSGDTHKPIGSPWGPPSLAQTPREFAPASTRAVPDIAILDTGVPSSARLALWHPALEGSIRRNVANAPYPDEDTLYTATGAATHELALEGGHGTFIAGLIHLLAPDVAMSAYAVLDADGLGDDATIGAALALVTLAGPPVPVVNLSLGGTTEDDEPPLALQQAVFKAPGSTVIVVSAGNEHSDQPHWPAAIKGAVSVGAIDEVDTLLQPTPFSDTGVWVDVSTLGMYLRSSYVEGNYPTGVGASEQFTAPAPTAVWSGTSFAAPVVAAEIARRMTEAPAGGPRPGGSITAEEAWVELRSGLRLNAAAPDLGVVYVPAVSPKDGP